MPPPATGAKERTSSRFLIDGGKPLRGAVDVSGSKNAALGAMAAALLTADDCYIENVPDIGARSTGRNVKPPPAALRAGALAEAAVFLYEPAQS